MYILLDVSKWNDNQLLLLLVVDGSLQGSPLLQGTIPQREWRGGIELAKVGRSLEFCLFGSSGPGVRG